MLQLIHIVTHRALQSKRCLHEQLSLTRSVGRVFLRLGRPMEKPVAFGWTVPMDGHQSTCAGWRFEYDLLAKGQKTNCCRTKFSRRIDIPAGVSGGRRPVLRGAHPPMSILNPVAPFTHFAAGRDRPAPRLSRPAPRLRDAKAALFCAAAETAAWRPPRGICCW